MFNSLKPYVYSSVIPKPFINYRLFLFNYLLNKFILYYHKTIESCVMCFHSCIIIPSCTLYLFVTLSLYTVFCIISPCISILLSCNIYFLHLSITALMLSYMLIYLLYSTHCIPRHLPAYR